MKSRGNHIIASALVLAGCATTPPPPRVRTHAPSACDVARRETVEHFPELYTENPSAMGSVRAEDFECEELEADLDGDGLPDVAAALAAHRGGAREYFLFLGRNPIVYAGHVRADDSVFGQFVCDHVQSNGLCDLHTSEIMIHGEVQTTTYRYDGSRYQAAESRLSEPEPR